MSKADIVEIVKRTGYSAATVGRALSGKGYCSEKAKTDILKVADELKYRPTFAARALRNNRTEKIIFCIPDICNPFYFNMIRSANEVLGKNGYYTMLCYTKHNIKEELKMIRLLTEKYADGMIMVSFNFCDENVKAIKESGMPVVITNLYDKESADDNFDCVYVDHTRAFYLATEHLIQQGNRQIALFIGDLAEQTGAERAKGYFDALKDNHIAINDSLIYCAEYTKEAGYKAAKKMLAEGSFPPAIVAANDLIALGIMTACSEMRVNVPNDISIVSMDNTEFSTSVTPMLTTVDLRQDQIGQIASELLLERILDGRKWKKSIRLLPELIVRESSIKKSL